jgi:hypothetical protein
MEPQDPTSLIDPIAPRARARACWVQACGSAHACRRGVGGVGCGCGFCCCVCVCLTLTQAHSDHPDQVVGDSSGRCRLTGFRGAHLFAGLCRVGPKGHLHLHRAAFLRSALALLLPCAPTGEWMEPCRRQHATSSKLRARWSIIPHAPLALRRTAEPVSADRHRTVTRHNAHTQCNTRQTANGNGARDRARRGTARRGAARSALRTLTLSISASSAEYLVRSDARSRGFFLPSAPSTSAPGLGSPPAHIFTGTGLNPAHICATTRAHACPQSAQGLRSPSASPSEPPLMSSTTCSSSVSPPSSASDEAM